MKWNLIDANLLIDKLYLINEAVFLFCNRAPYQCIVWVLFSIMSNNSKKKPQELFICVDDFAIKKICI